jgi:hypothetical protein
MLLKVKSKKTRAKSGLMMLEGKRLIQDACEAGMVPLMIFFSRKDDLKDLYSPFHNTKYFKTPYKDIQNWSDLTTSPGIIGNGYFHLKRFTTVEKLPTLKQLFYSRSV